MSESSAGALGRAVELITFARARPTGAGRVWRYAVADHDVSVAGVTYRAAVLTRGAIRRGDSGKESCELEASLELPCLAEWRSEGGAVAGLAAETPTTVQILRAYVASPGDGSAAAAATSPAPLFLGELAGIELEGSTATLTVNSLRTLFDRAIPRVPIGRQCPWTLYDERCGVDRTAHVWTGTITARGVSESGPTLTVTMDAPSLPTTVDGDPDPYRFVGGTLATTPTAGADAGKETARVGITGTPLYSWPMLVLALLRDDAAFTVGATVRLAAGCDRYQATCIGRFANGRRFGGFPSLPNRDPMRDGLQ